MRGTQRLTGMSANQAVLPLAGSVFEFARYGKSGAWVSELLPHTASVVDELCFVKSLWTEAINHDPAVTFFQTGSQIAGIRQAALGAGQPLRHHRGRRPLRFPERGAVPGGKRRSDPGRIGQMTALAITIKDIAAEIPSDLKWVLRVDGHTDPQPVKGGQFASNWELSAQRAITVVKLLIADGVPADHLAATAFGEYQPFGPGDTPDAYSKDRRIELRLTDR